MNQQQVAPIEKKALGAFTVYRSNVSMRLKQFRHRHKYSHWPEADQNSINETQTINQVDDEGLDEVDKLRDIVQESSDILAEANSIFPFAIPSNKIIVDKHMLTIIYKMPFINAQKVSIAIEDIKNVQADFGIFFSSITVTSDHFVNNIQKVNYLSRESAEEIQKLVQGAVVASKEEVNISKVESKDLKGLLQKLGESKTQA
jgi:hypothetical protein